jgi:hypothetical protein
VGGQRWNIQKRGNPGMTMDELKGRNAKNLAKAIHGKKEGQNQMGENLGKTIRKP